MSHPLSDHAALSERALTELAIQVRDHTSLEKVLAWCRGQDPPRGIDEIVTQDEYTHDVIVRYDRARYLVYDVT